MKHILHTALAIISAGLPAAALAQKPSVPSPQVHLGQEARIPFVSLRTIRTFHPVGYDTVYLQDQRRNWYRASLFGPCLNLGRSLRIGVDTRYGNTLDSSSSFIVGGESCRIESLVHSEAPPRRRR